MPRPAGWITSEEALARFVEALTLAGTGDTGAAPAPSLPRSPAARNRASAAADEALRSRGY